MRARGGREQCDGSGCPCAEGSSPRMCAGDRGAGAGLSEAVAACGGARRCSAEPGFALLRSSAPSAARGARPGEYPAAPTARWVRGAPGEKISRRERRNAAERGCGDPGHRGREGAGLVVERRWEHRRGRPVAPPGV